MVEPGSGGRRDTLQSARDAGLGEVEGRQLLLTGLEVSADTKEIDRDESQQQENTERGRAKEPLEKPLPFEGGVQPARDRRSPRAPSPRAMVAPPAASGIQSSAPVRAVDPAPVVTLVVVGVVGVVGWGVCGDCGV